MQDHKFVETLVWFPVKKKLTETMDRMAIIDAKKVLKQRLDFLVKEKVETMDGLAITQGQTIVETTFRFSDWRNN